MPLPKPKKNEKEQDFVSRCISAAIGDGTFENTPKGRAQATAACFQTWRDSKKGEEGEGKDESPPWLSPETINRAYSVLHVKSVNVDQRTIKGTATTPSPDRLGDVVEPLGIKFKNPLPLLWQHKHDQPVGWAKFAKATEDGIEFEAQLPTVEEAGTLRERINEAWQSVKLGLVRGVSIGFRALEFSFMDKGGIHFQETEVIELSLVTIPANMEATITSIKAMDNQQEAASGQPAPLDSARTASLPNDQRKTLPASRDQHKAAQALKDAKKMPKSVADNIAAFEAKRAAQTARMNAIMEKAAEDGSTLDQAESEEYDTLEQGNAQIDGHLNRLRKLEEQNKSLAKPAGSENGKDPHSVTLPGNGRVISVKSAAPPGTGFIRLCIAEAYGRGDTQKAIQRASEYHDMPELAEIMRIGIRPMMDIVKAATPAGTTTDSVWAAPLVTFQVLASEFIELLRPATIIGRIPNLRRVPFNIQMPAATTGTSVNWVGEGAPKAVTSMSFTTVTLRWAKAAGIVILTDELVRFSNPAAEAVVRADLIAAMAQFLDRQFVDPAVAEIVNVSPASITNGVTAIVPSGTTEAALRSDIARLMNAFMAANLTTAGGVWIMTQQQAMRLSLIVNALGQPSFPTITGTGGTFLGYPVIASENLPSSTGSPAEGFPIIFALAPEIMLADDGQTVIDASNQASVQADTAPDSPPTASTAYISLWQMNMTGLRCERWINWKKRRATAVGYITSALYG
jgi:HK97 family phage major capsid protein/HK97 family phage prohead protease